MRPRVIPGKIALLFGAVSTAPSRTPKKLVCVPSVSAPSGKQKSASTQSCSFAACMASTLASRFVDLMSQRSQRLSGWVLTAPPVRRALR